MKKSTKLLSLALALGMTASMVACNNPTQGPGGGNYETGLQGELTVLAMDKGYGLVWLNSIIDAYEANNPDVKVTIKPTVQEDTELSKIEQGIYVGDLVYGTVVTNSRGRNGYFINIEDVYNTTPAGETKTIKEKIGEDLVEEYFHDDYSGEYYSIPVFDAMSSVLYNKTSLDTMFGEGKWELPNTTDELYALSQRVIATGNVPFTYCLNELAGYMSSMPSVFLAQQIGYEGYTKFQNGYLKNAEGEYVEDKTGDMYVTNTAYMNALKDTARFFEKSTGMTSEATLDMDFVKAQAYFWGQGYGTDKRLAAFMVNADWMWNEMEYLEAIKHADIRYMRMPITSSIIASTPSIIDDVELSALVEAIDAGNPALVGEGFSYEVTQEDYDKIAEARKIVHSGFSQQIMSLAHNAKNYELAKDFLAFMCSDTAQMLKSEALRGDTNLINRDIIDKTKSTSFMESKQEILKNSIMICGTNASAKMNIAGGIWKVAGFPQMLYNGTFVSYVEGSTWKDLFKSAYQEKRIAAGLSVN